MKTITGIIHGKIIELSDHPGLPEGEVVAVQVTPLKSARPAGEGLRRCAGALAGTWTEADDRILEQIEQDRRNATFREPVE